MSTIKLRPIEEKARVPKLAVAAIGLLTVGVIVFFISIQLRQPRTIIPPPKPVEFVQVTQAVTVGEDITIVVDNVSFFMPKDAITLEGSLLITQVQPDQYVAEGQSGWYQLQVAKVEYLDGNGKPYPRVVFFTPAKICFTLTEEQWNDHSQHPSDYQVQYFAEQENPPIWEPLLKTLNPEQKQVCGNSSHLTLFSLAVWKQVLVPITGSTPSPTPLIQASPTDTDTDQREDQRQPTNPPATNPPRTQPPPVVTDPPSTEPPTEPPPPTKPPEEPPEEPTEPAEVPTDPPVPPSP
jgi:hypothetical protein